jgi:tetratricopeptide (TPR) repeat protein
MFRTTLTSLGLCALVALSACGSHDRVTLTVAQVERVRAGVTLSEIAGAASPVDGLLRLTPGAVTTTDDAGRALLILDHGERVLLDHNTRVRVTSASTLELEAGRAWVSAAGVVDPMADEGASMVTGAATMRLRGARASVERQGDGASIDVLGGEVAWAAGARQGAVHAGEHAELSNGAARVTARTLFDDWTGGLADDLPTGVTVGAAMGLGSVAARRPDEQGAPRWPLAVQRVDARVSIVGDLAVTELEETFFNPAADTVEGIYTLTVPRGAVLQRFAVDRHGTMVDGFVREKTVAARDYQAQVYAGSTHDPALLEWDAPGRYHARLYPITPGMTRKVLVTYTQWLSARPDGGRAWRLPLASLGTRIGELRVDVDVSRSGANDVRASEGARRDDTHVTLTRSDVIPTADFVLDLRGAPPREASAVRVPPSGRSGPNEDRYGFVRVAVQAPAPEARASRDEGVDLVVVVDHSAATDPVSLQLGQSFAEALARSLSGRDRLLVLAGDVDTRSVGREQARLEAVTPASRQALLDALARDRRGGATDLGAMIEAAQGALDPQRNGAIVYIGDGNATVGEGDLPALRARLARMSPHPRLYAVAVGEAPRLDLLAGITEPSGFAARVARRADVARTALDLVEHASRPLVRDFRVDLGPNVDRVYPNGPVDVPAGEPLVIVGRYAKDPPGSVTVRASWNGRATVRTVPLSTMVLSDHDDLRYRWASARLDHLLATGESRAVVVELGTRFGLITPFTSLYVPSEDEPMPPRNPRTSDARDLSFFDLVPLVGCRQASESAPPTSVSAATPSAQTRSANESAEEHAAAAEAPSGGQGANNGSVHGERGVDRGRFMARGATSDQSEVAQPSDPAAATIALAQNMPAPPPVTTPTTAEPEAAPAPVALAPMAAQPAMRAARAPSPSSATSVEDLVFGGETPTRRRASLGSGGGATAHSRREVNVRGGSFGGLDEQASNRAQNARAGDFEIGGRDAADGDGTVDARLARGGDHEAVQAAARVLSRCSDAAAVTLPERVALWRERLATHGGPAGALRLWTDAKRACELPAWPDRVALLRLIVGEVGDVDGQIALYQAFRHEPGARAWVRDVLLRTLARTGELSRASSLGLARLDAETLTAALSHAATPQERLNVLRLLARRYPDDLELTLLLLDAAAAGHDDAEVRRTAGRLREDPRTDARVRTAVGEALLAIGDEAEARRTFSEIVEFAPDDPWARRRLGDLGLAHGWAVEAYRQFQTLATALNEAPEILLRLAWAARAAGRFDEALRLAERVTTQTAPGTAGTVSEAAAAWIAAELALAGTTAGVAPETLTALRSRWRRSPAARSAGAVRVVLRWTHPDDEAELWVATPSEPTHRADLVAALVPLETSVWAEAPESLQIELRRGGGGRPRGAAEVIVIWNEGTDRERVAQQRVSFDPEHPRFAFDARDGVLSPRATETPTTAPAPARGRAR